jgi:tRNA A37 N6-isopentenylltransferase MiaA
MTNWDEEDFYIISKAAREILPDDDRKLLKALEIIFLWQKKSSLEDVKGKFCSLGNGRFVLMFKMKISNFLEVN